jgi:monovalent cation:H+ antiporter, CPA1 family
MSDRTQGYGSSLWTLIDEVLNSALLLLIGLEVFILRFRPAAFGLAIQGTTLGMVARRTLPAASMDQASLVGRRLPST